MISDPPPTWRGACTSLSTSWNVACNSQPMLEEHAIAIAIRSFYMLDDANSTSSKHDLKSLRTAHPLRSKSLHAFVLSPIVIPLYFSSSSPPANACLFAVIRSCLLSRAARVLSRLICISSFRMRSRAFSALALWICERNQQPYHAIAYEVRVEVGGRQAMTGAR